MIKSALFKVRSIACCTFSPSFGQFVNTTSGKIFPFCCQPFIELFFTSSYEDYKSVCLFPLVGGDVVSDLDWHHDICASPRRKHYSLVFFQVTIWDQSVFVLGKTESRNQMASLQEVQQQSSWKPARTVLQGLRGTWHLRFFDSYGKIKPAEP